MGRGRVCVSPFDPANFRNIHVLIWCFVMTWLLFPLLISLILFICIATLFGEGIWSNAILLVNVVTAALLATNFFEPMAQWLESQSPSGSYLWDFLSLWGLFALFLAVMRMLTDHVSRVKVRFKMAADYIGGGFFALWIGCVMVCFTMMTLHTAPLCRNFLYQGFQPEQRMIMGLAPDRKWLGFVQKMSRYNFCRSAAPEEVLERKYVFDRDFEFMHKYATRRTGLADFVSKNNTVIVSTR